MRATILFYLFFSGSALVIAQTTWYVRADASPVGADASSWATATPHLQDAMEAALPGDAVWVAAGVYKPTTTGNRLASFLIKNGVRVYGGFAGTEALPEERDWTAHPTILSGDIGVPNDSTDNSYCILYAAKTNLNTRVDGLVFERGNAGHPDNVNVFSHQPGHSGSAIYLDGQGPGNFAYLTIANCTFRHNRSDHFGAVYANGRDSGKTTVRIENSTFALNKANFKGGALAVENYALQPEPLLLDGAVFTENYGHSGGGALYAEHYQDIHMLRCRFERNEVFGGVGGAISLFASGQVSAVRFRDCAFTGNFTTNNLAGGALDYYIFSGSSSLDFDNCTFAGNKATEGGCINVFNTGSTQCPLRFRQCLFVRNTAYGSVLTASLAQQLGGLRFTNCIFYKNEGPEILMLDNMADTVLLHNSIVCKLPDAAPFLEGINPLRISHCLTDLPNCSRFGIKANCIAGLLFNSNPFFVNPDASDFHLQPCSPAVDAGSNALAAGLLTDFDGGPRVRAGAIDLGPFEHDLGFVPTAIKAASCPDARDGSVVFGGSSCPPVLILWVKGDEFGSGTDSLAPGVYVFSFTDAAGHTAMETVVIPAPPGLSLLPNVAPPLCVGLNNGVAGVDIGGGTPPYQIDWGGGNTGNFLFSVPAGTYPVTVTDSRGCLTSAAIEVPAPGMVEVFYTVTPASAPQQANGSIQIDSVWGCTGPFQWNAPTLTNLSPGTYAVTVTDPCGCVQVFPIVVGIAVAAGEVGSGAPAVWLSPNPAPAGGTSVLRWTGAAPETLSVYDMAGRALRRMAAPPGVGQLEVQAPEAAGVYRLVVRGAGWQGVLRWVVW